MVWRFNQYELNSRDVLVVLIISVVKTIKNKKTKINGTPVTKKILTIFELIEFWEESNTVIFHKF